MRKVESALLAAAIAVMAVAIVTTAGAAHTDRATRAGAGARAEGEIKAKVAKIEVPLRASSLLDEFRRAARLWRQEGHRVRVGTDCDRDEFLCVRVLARDWGDTEWAARTWTDRAEGEIQVNTRDRWTQAEALTITCHETGHVVGIGHNNSEGCMNRDTPYRWIKP